MNPRNKTPAQQLVGKLSWAQEELLRQLVALEQRGQAGIAYPFPGHWANPGRALERKGLIRVAEIPGNIAAFVSDLGHEVYAELTARAAKAAAAQAANGQPMARLSDPQVRLLLAVDEQIKGQSDAPLTGNDFRLGKILVREGLAISPSPRRIVLTEQGRERAEIERQRRSR